MLFRFFKCFSQMLNCYKYALFFQVTCVQFSETACNYKSRKSNALCWTLQASATGHLPTQTCRYELKLSLNNHFNSSLVCLNDSFGCDWMPWHKTFPILLIVKAIFIILYLYDISPFPTLPYRLLSLRLCFLSNSMDLECEDSFLNLPVKHLCLTIYYIEH